MVKRLLRWTSRWRTLESRGGRLVGAFASSTADRFEGFTGTSLAPGASGAIALRSQFRAPAPVSIAPATFETRFVRLHAEGRFDEMWDMIAEDAQRAWGGRENFVREMPRLDEWMEIIDLQAVDVAILDSWTDLVHQRTYANVAQLVMRYHVRQQWKEWSFDRHVHLVPGPGGWRTLCYPMRVRTAASR